MSFHIVQILDGGIDLETMEIIPKSLLVAYKAKRVLVPITDEQLGIIQSLIVDVAKESEVTRQPATKKNGTPAPVTDSEYDDPETGVSAF